MGTDRIITCEDCKSQYSTRRANTKYCPICRWLRDLKFIGGRTRKCWLCDTEFAPLSSKSEMCGSCDDVPRRSHVAGECGFCKQEKPNLLHDDLHVCVSCALNPECRRTLVMALKKKQDARIADPVQITTTEA